MARFEPQSSWCPRSWAGLPALALVAEELRALDAHADWPDVDAYDALLAAGLEAAKVPPLRCEVQEPKPRRRRRRPELRAELYDARIAEGGCLPTRLRNGHDLFNVLVWSRFPRSKWALHRRQNAILRARLPERLDGLPGARTREQDALTGFDEGGLVILVESRTAAAVEAALARREAEPLHAAIAERRATALLFGHALYDHLIAEAAPVWGAPVLLPVAEAPTDLRRAAAVADPFLNRVLEDPERFTRPGRMGVPIDSRLFA